MLDRLPVQIHPLRLVASRDILQGELPISKMHRLTELVQDSEGNAAITLQFQRDENEQPIIRTDVKAALNMTCMRCGQPMTYHIDNASILGLVEAESEAENLPDDYEPLLVGNDPLNLSDIVEDELLLALPIVAMHEDNDCLQQWLPEEDEEDSPAEATKTDNPFAKLADLKPKMKE